LIFSSAFSLEFSVNHVAMKEQKFFINYWKIVQYFGVCHCKLNAYQKTRAILYFLSTAVVNFVLYFVALYVYDDPKVRLNGLQTLPFFFQMLLDGSNFAAKCRVIENLYDRIDEAYKRINGEAHFKIGHKKFLAYFTFCGVLGTVSSVGGIFVFLFTRKTPVLIYTPYDHGFGFFVIWFLQTIFFIYSGVLNFLLDTFMNGLLVSLSYYVKALRIYIKTKGISDMREINELDLELRE
jgi:hypothetical protein